MPGGPVTEKQVKATNLQHSPRDCWPAWMLQPLTVEAWWERGLQSAPSLNPLKKWQPLPEAPLAWLAGWALLGCVSKQKGYRQADDSTSKVYWYSTLMYSCASHRTSLPLPNQGRLLPGIYQVGPCYSILAIVTWTAHGNPTHWLF